MIQQSLPKRVNKQANEKTGNNQKFSKEAKNTSQNNETINQTQRYVSLTNNQIKKNKKHNKLANNERSLRKQMIIQADSHLDRRWVHLKIEFIRKLGSSEN